MKRKEVDVFENDKGDPVCNDCIQAKNYPRREFQEVTIDEPTKCADCGDLCISSD